MEAMKALIGGIGPGTPLGQLTFDLLSPTMSRDGKHPFSKELLSGTLTDVLEKRASVSQVIEENGHTRKEEVAKLVNRTTDISSVSQDAGYIIEVAQNLVEKTQVTTAETFGQCLWRNRDEECLKNQPHCDIVEDLQWVEDPRYASAIIDMVSTVFRELTHDKGGRMTSRLWAKAIDLMKGNPIIRERHKRNDSDRLFHAEAMREFRERGNKGDSSNDNSGFSIGLSRFLGLLVDMSSIMKVHPFMVFLAVGCHAEVLETDRLDRQANAKGNAQSSSGVPGRSRTLELRQPEQRPSRRGS